MTKKQKRYSKVDGYTGIYKDSKNDTFLARKKINGKEYSRTFDRISDASRWKRDFHPSIPDNFRSRETVKISNKKEKFTVEVEKRNKVEDFENGRDYGMSFGDLVKAYFEKKLPSLAFSSREAVEYKLSFFKELHKVPLININHFYLDRFMTKKVAEFKKICTSRRCNFDNELDALKAILNWYRVNYDPSFFNPVLQRHKDMGVIKVKNKKNKKMKPEQILMFFDALEGIWKDLAITQFYIAGRIQEVAGLQVGSVDLKERSILIKDVVVWNRYKHFQELRNVTKNGDTRYVYMNDILRECLERRLRLLDSKSNFLFHLGDGQPLGYRGIQYNYNKALKKCGLFPEFSSTHIMRHSMGTITRMVTGNLDAAQAVTGHKDIRMVQHYANLPSTANKDAVNQVEDYLEKLKLA